MLFRVWAEDQAILTIHTWKWHKDYNSMQPTVSLITHHVICGDQQSFCFDGKGFFLHPSPFVQALNRLKEITVL